MLWLFATWVLLRAAHTKNRFGQPYYMMTSECSYSWCTVSVFSSSLSVDCVYQHTPTFWLRL